MRQWVADLVLGKYQIVDKELDFILTLCEAAGRIISQNI